jgi:hypothetical protein
MQIRIAVITAASVAAVIAMPVFAEDSTGTTPTTTGTNTTGEMGVRTHGFASPNPSGIREQMQANRQARAALRAENLSKTCGLLETNMANLIAKIQARITAAQNEGKNVSAAVTAVASANSDLANATSLCNQAVAQFNSVPVAQWSEQNPIIVQARALAKQARDSFMKTRTDIIAAIKAIRGLGTPGANAEGAAHIVGSPTPTGSSTGSKTPAGQY